MKTITTELDTGSRTLALRAELDMVADHWDKDSGRAVSLWSKKFDQIAKAAGVPGREFMYRGVKFRRVL